jgi:hypothetical protein
MVRVHYQLEEIGDPASTSDVGPSHLILSILLTDLQEDQIVVGRICCDEDVKLNDASVVLETSRLMGAGARVPLKFDPNVTINSNTSLCPMFPGAILALKGRNETGEWFQVSQILTVGSFLAQCILYLSISTSFQCPQKASSRVDKYDQYPWLWQPGPSLRTQICLILHFKIS